MHAIEAGKFAPSLVLAFKISTLFGVDLNDVFAPDAEETLPSLLEPQELPNSTIRVDTRDAPRPLVFFRKS